jgi:nitroimidazol reductase NimA-like FMN-containing flavoprotein (pyridoxamine 5'-phosphate oxidase superfamily)
MSNSPPKQLPNGNQLKFLNAREVGRLAVADKDGMPHVTPIIYAMDGVYPVIATDYGTKKLKILLQNNKAGLVVDDVNPNKGVMIQGSVVIFERGKEYLRLLKVLVDRLEFYKENPWGEGESPLIRISPEHVTSWGV